MLIDLGATEPLIQEPEILRGSTLLEFANIAPIEVPTLPLEQHIAQKVHAYTRTYGHGLPSSRAKDLVDLALLGSHASPSAEHLGNALEAVFRQRGLQPLPSLKPCRLRPQNGALPIAGLPPKWVSSRTCVRDTFKRVG